MSAPTSGGSPRLAAAPIVGAHIELRSAVADAATAVPRAVEEHLVAVRAPAGAETEAYRALRLSIDRLAPQGSPVVVAVTSARDGDGKSTTAINLAAAIAHDRTARVLLVDADLRNPAVGARLALPDHAPGLADALSGAETSIERLVRRRADAAMDIVTAGRAVASPSEILRGSRLAEFLTDARRRYDYVIVDVPSLVPHPDCRLLRAAIDVFLIVVVPGRTPRELVADALDAMEPGTPAGFVLNHRDRRVPGPRPPAARGRRERGATS